MANKTDIFDENYIRQIADKWLTNIVIPQVYDDSLSYYRVKAATYDDNDIWICTDLFSCIGSFEVMPLDLFMDYLKYLEYNSETKCKEVVLYFDKLFDYHF